MIWLTWRQHRAQVLVTAGLLLGLGVFLLVHGLRTADLAARLERGLASGAHHGQRRRVRAQGQPRCAIPVPISGTLRSSTSARARVAVV